MMMFALKAAQAPECTADSVPAVAEELVNKTPVAAAEAEAAAHKSELLCVIRRERESGALQRISQPLSGHLLLRIVTSHLHLHSHLLL